MRIGLLGGSFNPPHNGHLSMARAARDALSLDEVWFVVAARPPHKEGKSLASFEERFEMARAAAREEPFLRACDIEGGLPGASYTFRTLEAIRAARRRDELFFIMGADTVTELGTWKNPARVLEIAHPVVVPRAAFSARDVQKLAGVLAPGQLELLRNGYLNVEPVDVSSTLVREKVGKGERVCGLVPAGVASYIVRHRLYGQA